MWTRMLGSESRTYVADSNGFKKEDSDIFHILADDKAALRFKMPAGFLSHLVSSQPSMEWVSLPSLKTVSHIPVSFVAPFRFTAGGLGSQGNLFALVGLSEATGTDTLYVYEKQTLKEVAQLSLGRLASIRDFRVVNGTLVVGLATTNGVEAYELSTDSAYLLRKIGVMTCPPDDTQYSLRVTPTRYFVMTFDPPVLHAFGFEDGGGHQALGDFNLPEETDGWNFEISARGDLLICWTKKNVKLLQIGNAGLEEAAEETEAFLRALSKLRER